MTHLSEAQLSGLTGLAFGRLGDRREATIHLQAAIAGTKAYPRERNAWQIRLAQNFVRAGDVADGCNLLIDNFEDVTNVASARLQSALAEVADELRPHALVTEAREFLGMWMAR